MEWLGQKSSESRLRRRVHIDNFSSYSWIEEKWRRRLRSLKVEEVLFTWSVLHWNRIDYIPRRKSVSREDDVGNVGTIRKEMHLSSHPSNLCVMHCASYWGSKEGLNEHKCCPVENPRWAKVFMKVNEVRIQTESLASGRERNLFFHRNEVKWTWWMQTCL